MIYQIVQNDDGTIVVRDFFSGKEIPLEEADGVLDTLKDRSVKEEKEEGAVPFIRGCPTIGEVAE